MTEHFPGCLGYYGIPLPPNGPCEKCKLKEICGYTAKHFVPKQRLQPILMKLLALERALEK